jgi:hypothetical protein
VAPAHIFRLPGSEPATRGRFALIFASLTFLQIDRLYADATHFVVIPLTWLSTRVPAALIARRSTAGIMIFRTLPPRSFILYLLWVIRLRRHALPTLSKLISLLVLTSTILSSLPGAKLADRRAMP